MWIRGHIFHPSYKSGKLKRVMESRGLSSVTPRYIAFHNPDQNV